ncbi:MAG: phage portal protein [Anaerorhabdus sp.]|uniref:phage portal protein n=1 Tax=Anaerorhabdus sp. TaxID=1872524 RepID=UPI002FC878B2
MFNLNFKFLKRSGIETGDSYIVSDQYIETKALQFAINAGIDIIASLLSKCEFKIYKNNSLNKSDTWYLFNVEPNKNENASSFWRKVFHKALIEDGALVFQLNNEFYLADSYTMNEPNSIFSQKTYSNIYTNGNQVYKTFLEEDVFLFDLKNENINKLMNDLYSHYGKLLSSSINHIKGRKSRKWIFKKDNAATGIGGIKVDVKSDDEDQVSKTNDSVKKFVESDGTAILQLGNGKTLEDKSSLATSDTRDARNLLNDVFDIVCIGLHLPKKIFYAESLNDDEFVALMTFIDPMIQVIEDECNRKYYGKRVLNGNKIKIYRNKVKYIDIFSCAQKLESLFRIGFSLNELMSYLNEEQIDEEWANERFVTKNYMRYADMMKGGE